MAVTIPGMAKNKKPAQSEAPKPAPPETESVRIDKDLARMASLLAKARDVAISEVLSPLLRPALKKAYAQEIRNLADNLDDGNDC